MPPEARSRGHLNPSSAARVSRFPPPADLANLIVHFWVPEWNLPRGESSRQVVLTYPVVNAVVQPGAPEGDLTVYGPRTRVSYRVLVGSGWGVGALLRPAAVPAVLALAGPSSASAARGLVDECAAIEDPRLVSEVTAAMQPGAARRASDGVVASGSKRPLEAGVEVLATWLRARLFAAGAPDRDGLLANALLELLDALPAGAEHRASELVPRRVADAARLLGTSSRTLERVALAYTGFTPAALIRRRRLQEAAERLRCDPTLELAELAQELGYADHAHLTRDFRQVLGFTPSGYRDRQVFSD